jgi:hypothetical protein
MMMMFERIFFVFFIDKFRNCLVKSWQWTVLKYINYNFVYFSLLEMNAFNSDFWLMLDFLKIGESSQGLNYKSRIIKRTYILNVLSKREANVFRRNFSNTSSRIKLIHFCEVCCIL